MQFENDRLEAAVRNLRTLMQSLDKEGKDEFATMSGTTRNYIYKIIGGNVRGLSAPLAFGIEDASRALHEKHGTPIVTARELAGL